MTKKIQQENKILRDKIVKGTRLAIKRLIAEEKKKNGYLVIARNGKVVKVKASEL